MKLPQIPKIRKGGTKISVFRGLNKTVNTGFSAVAKNSTSYYAEFKSMMNMSSDNYPQLSPRKPRSIAELERGLSSNVLIADGKLIFIDSEGYFNHGSSRVQIQGIAVGASHYLVQFGNRVVMLPDKLAVTLNSSHDVTALESSPLGNSHRYVIQPVGSGGSYDNANFCKAFLTVDGAFVIPKVFTRSTTPNTGQVNVGELAEAYSESPSTVYRKTESGVEEVQCNYFAIKKRAIDNALKAGDCVKLTVDFDRLAEYGDPQILVNTQIDPDYATYTTLDCILGSSSNYADDLSILREMDGNSYKIESVDKNYIYLRGEINRSLYLLDNSIKLEKVMPEHDEDKMIEVNNRLWTCSSKNNEIYACKLGDCTSWQNYMDGISTDSFAATVGCEGEFTAIARQNDNVIFFKENWILKLYGNKPSNFTLATYNVPGVEKGSGKSVVWINGVLYYLSPKGVCRYSPGAQPEVISEGAFGDRKYRNGIAGRHGDKYYLSAVNEDGENELFVFDTEKGMWHTEDNFRPDSCVSYNNSLYMINEADGIILSPDDRNTLLDGMPGYEREGGFEWACETGDLYDGTFNSKYIYRLMFGLRTDRSVRIRVLAQFEDGGAWSELGVLLYDDKKPRNIPLAVRRSEFLRLRLEGEGMCEIFGIDIEYSLGSAVR